MSGSDAEDENTQVQSIVNGLESTNKNGPLAPYLNAARWISLSMHPYMPLLRVFYAGVPGAFEGDHDEDHPDEEYSDEERAMFESIMKLVPNFKTVVDACAQAGTATFLTLVQRISEASQSGRTDDTGKLKTTIIQFLFEDVRKGSPFAYTVGYSPLVPKDGKEARGFNHIDTASLLCPIRLHEDFEAYPNGFMERVDEGSIKITAGEFPVFMYASGTDFHPKMEFEGLFRGYLLVRVYRHIFTGPSTAFTPTRNISNTCKARKFRLTRVTGRTIAYACVQARIALSSMSSWTAWDGVFDYEEFYDSIVNLFEFCPGPKDKWVMDTLAWWNEQVPGLSSRPHELRRKKATGPPDYHRPSGPTTAERIAAQIASAQLAQDSADAALDAPGDEAEKMHQAIASDVEANKLRQWFAAQARERAARNQEHPAPAAPTPPSISQDQDQQLPSDHGANTTKLQEIAKDIEGGGGGVISLVVPPPVSPAVSHRSALVISQARRAYDPDSESELSMPPSPVPAPLPSSTSKKRRAATSKKPAKATKRSKN